MNFYRVLGLALCAFSFAQAQPYKSVTDFGIAPTNSAAANKIALQKAIDWASPRGAALYLDPSDEPYPFDGGLVLK
ncbi:MAG: hypothetical protein ACXW32_05700, partial [Limisphaerales bacterium]